MRIVDRNEFLRLPVGTVYAKFGSPTDEAVIDFGDLCIKDENRGKDDWYANGASEPTPPTA
jgi:hypothetical protein